jgi:fructose/tagatose bisphosphate aldolase
MTNMTTHSLGDYRIGFGPMSREIVDILVNYTDYPLMIIASRNQVDYQSGYVYHTHELANSLGSKRKNILLCRDHCGPYFADTDKNLSVSDAINECKNTIKTDIQSGFDLIHIDVSRIHTNQLSYSQDLIEYALDLNPNILLEFGSEDNTGIDVESSIGRIEPQLEFLQKYQDNVAFFVTQTGSLTKQCQLGQFDVDSNKAVADLIHKAGFLFKEHNADYFTNKDLQHRILAGIDSLNIAPQLGVIQSTLLHEFAPRELWNKFSNLVYHGNYWQRWTNNYTIDQDSATKLGGHYCYGSKEYGTIINNIDYDEFKNQLSDKMQDLLKHYKFFIDCEDAD